MNTTTTRSIAFGLIWLIAAGAEAATETAPPSDETEIIQTMRAMFAALTTDDAAKFRILTSADFYTFDGGKRFTGDALLELLKAHHAAGKVYVWNVTEPEVHLHGDIAWITYVNQGSIQDASGTKNLTWLESAVLRKENGGWRIRFFHSTRAPREEPSKT
jgi:ketosteroid isomerase-like protein